MRWFLSLILVLVFLVFAGTQAFAGVLDAVKEFMAKEAFSLAAEIAGLVATAAVVIIASVFGIYYTKVTRTLKEFGEFLTTLGAALDDKKISREEITAIVKEGKDVFAVWL